MKHLMVRFRVKPGNEAEFERRMSAIGARVRAEEPGAVSLKLFRSQSDPSAYVALEVFRDDAAWDEHTGKVPTYEEVPLAAALCEGFGEMDFVDLIDDR